MASIRQGNHPYYQVAGKPPIRQPPQPTHQLPIIQMRKPVRSNLSKMKKTHLQRQKPLFSSLAFSSSPPSSSWLYIVVTMLLLVVSGAKLTRWLMVRLLVIDDQDPTPVNWKIERTYDYYCSKRILNIRCDPSYFPSTSNNTR